MARIFNAAGVIVHPDDELEDVDGQAPDVDESIVAAAELEVAGFVRDSKGNWWTAPDGRRLNGWRAALDYAGELLGD